MRMIRATRATLLWTAVALYAGTIFYLSSLQNPLPELASRFSDKVLHGIEYGGLGLLVTLALLGSGFRARRALGIAVIAASLYAASDEVHQAFVPGRDADVRDWFADSVGAIVGAFVAFYPNRKRIGERNERPSPRRSSI